MNIADMFNPGGGPGSPKADLAIEDEFKARVWRLLKHFYNASEEELLSLVVAEYHLLTAHQLEKWEQERQNLDRAKKACEAAADRILTQLNNGTIPEFLSDEKVCQLPACPWRAAVARTLVLIAIAGGALEWINYAAFCAPHYDSFPISLSNCLPVLLFAVAEAIILHCGLFSKRFIKWFMVGQGVAGVLSGCAYLLFRFQRSNASLDFLTQASQSHTLSPDDVCMFFQILTSLCFAAICLQGALAMWIKRSPRNSEYTQALTQIDELNEEAAELATKSADVKGAIAKFHALKDWGLNAAQTKRGRLVAEHDRFQRNFETILNQSL